MLAVIGGTGFNQFEGLEIVESKWFSTPYGDASAALQFGELDGKQVVFMARHGEPHSIPPHLINYRANVSALQQAGVTHIVAVNAVGGIADDLGPAMISIPNQIIDYTYGRAHTYFEGDQLEHVDFTYPYSEALRIALLDAAQQAGIEVIAHGTYGATQGPRLETAAEIQRCKRDGCTMVGMTGMPEAVLARELGMDYACLALSVNWAAGITPAIITMDDIQEAIDTGMHKVRSIVRTCITHFQAGQVA